MNIIFSIKKEEIILLINFILISKMKYNTCIVKSKFKQNPFKIKNLLVYIVLVIFNKIFNKPNYHYNKMKKSQSIILKNLKV